MQAKKREEHKTEVNNYDNFVLLSTSCYKVYG